MANNLDDLIRGVIRGYGNARGHVVPQNPSGMQVGQGNIGGRNARNRGRPGYPDNFNKLAPKANSNDDEGFAVQSEPMDGITSQIDASIDGKDKQGDELLNGMKSTNENKWLRSLVAAGTLAAASHGNSADVTPTKPERHAVTRSAALDDTSTAPAEEVDHEIGVDDYIREAALETGVQPELIRAIMRIESMNNPKAISGKGARGPMQLMPNTAVEMGVDDPHDMRQGILGGARYLQKTANIFHGDLVHTIAAYNAGPNRIIGRKRSEYPEETQNYLIRVLKLLPRKFRKVSYKPLSSTEMKQRSSLVTPRTVMKEGGPIDRMTGVTDLSGRKERTPELDDAILKNGGDPRDNPVPGPFTENLDKVIGDVVRGHLHEERQTRVAVTGGDFQPFHRGHSAVIRKLAGSVPKVIIFTFPGKPFSPKTIVTLMKASLADIWDKIEIYPGTADLQADAQRLMGRPGTTLNTNSIVTFHPMPADDEISSKRAQEALQDDEKDMVRKMLDPLVSTDESEFEQIYGQLRRELGANGRKPSKVVTDAPVPTHRESELAEMSAGAMATTVGDTRTGRHGGSAWSSYNPRNKGPDGDAGQYQQFLRSPPSRMLDLTNSGIPDDHLPGGGELDQHLIGDDKDKPSELKDPTDLSEMIKALLCFAPEATS